MTAIIKSSIYNSRGKILGVKIMGINYSEEQLNLYSRLAKLTEEYKRGKEEAFSEMYELMLPHVNMMVKSRGVPESDVADIVSDAMVKVYKGINTIKDSQATYKWIMKVTSNLVSDYFKKSEYKEVFVGDIVGNENTSEEEIYRKSHQAGAFTLVVPEDILVNKERQKILFQMVEELKPDQKQILMMHCFDEKTFKEIAVNMGMSENSVKTKFYRTLNKLESSILDMEKNEGIRLHSIGLVPVIFSIYVYVSSTSAVPTSVSGKAALAVSEVQKLSSGKSIITGAKAQAGGAAAVGTKAAAAVSGKVIAAIVVGVVGVGTIAGVTITYFHNENAEEVVKEVETESEIESEETESLNDGSEITDSEESNEDSAIILADGEYSSDCSGDEQKTGPSTYSNCKATFKNAYIKDGNLILEGRLVYNSDEVFEYATYTVPVSDNCDFEWAINSSYFGPDDEVEKFNYWFEDSDGVGFGVMLTIKDGKLVSVYYGV